MAGSGTGTNSSGGNASIVGGNSTGSGTSGNASVIAGSSFTGTGGNAFIHAGGATSGTGGTVFLVPGSGAAIGANGNITIGAGTGTTNFVFYLGQSTVTNLPSPPPQNVYTSSSVGAMIFASDAKGAADGAAWGSVAVTGGNGAIVRYSHAATWIVVG